MSVDEILEAISKTESWDDLQRIARALKSRNDRLSQLALQRVKQNFKMADRIKIKDEKGKYHSGMFFGVIGNKVRFHINNQEIKVSPLNFERLEPEVVERHAPQEVRKMTPEEVKKRADAEDAVDKMLGIK